MLSVCMIVKNEETMLPGCLESVKNIASEIIIVDTGSNDSTMDIARQYGARVLEFPWNNNFAEARNMALTEARNPWILSIDADERITNPEELAFVLQHAAKDTYGFMVNLTSHAVKHGTTTKYVSQLLRLFRNHPAIKFEGMIHEQVVDCFTKWNFGFGASNIEVEHLGYNLSPEQMQAKQLRNLELLDYAISKTPTDAYMLYQRAKTYLALGNLRGAEHDTQQALTYAEPKGTVRPQALNYGGIIAYQLGDMNTAIQRAKESLTIVPKQAFSYYVLGECYTAQNNFTEALNAYLKLHEALEANDVLARVVGAYEMPGEQLAFCIGRSYLALGKQPEAEQYFKAGLLVNPNDVSCRIGLANCAMNNHKYSEARGLLYEAQTLSGNREDIAAFLTRVDEVEKQYAAIQQGTQPTTQRAKPFLSLCMIVKNEEDTLAECLESVRGVADEIVIVDTGSTDNTVAIAKRYGATVGYFEWIGDFAAARNEALKLCTGEWILYLDADERLQKESGAVVLQQLQSVPAQVGGVICTIVSPHRQTDDVSEVHKGGYPRIFRNYGYPNLYFKGRVHEQITPSLLEQGAHIIQSDIVINHTGYDIPRDEMEKKVQRNYELLIRHVQEEPLNAYAWFQLGQTLGRMDLAQKSEEALKFALDLGTLSTPIAATAASTVAHICGTQQRFDEALKWAEVSLSKVPNQVLALNYKAYALLHLGRLDEAEQTFNHVLTIMDNSTGSPEAGFDIELKKDVVFEGLKKIHQLRGNRITVHA